MRRLIGLLAMPILLLALTGPALGISYGQVDANNKYSNVGALMAEVEGGLVGDAYLANDLCSAGGPVTAGAAEPLSDPTDVQPFDSAFGADAAAQLQVVALDGPVPLRAVLAPVEDRWQVVGLLPKSNIP